MFNVAPLLKLAQKAVAPTPSQIARFVDLRPVVETLLKKGHTKLAVRNWLAENAKELKLKPVTFQAAAKDPLYRFVRTVADSPHLQLPRPRQHRQRRRRDQQLDTAHAS